MATVQVPTGRATMSESPDGLLITIPAKKNWFVILFMAFWLVGWFFGEVTAIQQIIRGHLPHGTNLKGGLPIGVNLFLLVWLGGWTIGGAFALITWSWNFAGVEKVQLGHFTLTTKREVFGIGPLKEFKLGNVANLRINMGWSNATQLMGHFQMMNGGTIAFDYGAKTFRFGVGLDEAEAEQIIARLSARHTF